MHAKPSYLFHFAYFIFLFDIFQEVVTSAVKSSDIDSKFLNCNSSATALPAEVHTLSPKELSESKLSNIYVESAESPGNPLPNKIGVAIFPTAFTYTTSVCPGTKFIRLHFYPISYLGSPASKALFSVNIGRYTLFSTSKSSFLKHLSHRPVYVIKEFCVTVDSDILNVTFTPLNSRGAYAFVNKIEIVSVPSNLYISENNQKPIALETVYRVNIGGKSISAELDSGMFRAWSEDKTFLDSGEHDTATLGTKANINYSSEVPAYTAPENVYATARTTIPKDYIDENFSTNYMSWKFPIEFGFCYLVRLHFCEISPKITQQNQRVFQVYINGLNTEDHADVMQWSGGDYVPVFRDYMVNLSGTDIDYLQIILQSNSGSAIPYSQAILNGLEIMKLSDASNNLAGSSPYGYGARMLSYESDKLCWRWLPQGLLIGFFALTLVSLIVLYITKPKRALMQWQSDHFRLFSLPGIKLATNNFSESLLVGTGGFWKVYKGSIDGGNTTVAVKRANPSANQGLNEFKTELSMLSNVQHKHLVSLIGYCMENKEMILVYDYMARGTLRDHLYNNHKDQPPVEWKRRLKICIGAARGLHYLHAGAKHTIIHRDVKSTNILLDDNWVAKVSDFGLSKIGPDMLTQANTHVSTVVKGTFGYLDPEYYRRQKLTEKSDVYSFGVVLFEVLCARPAVLSMVDKEEEHEKVSLAEWALRCYQSGTLDTIVDPYLRGKIDPECFRTFTDTAKKCLADRGCDRPPMGDVLWNLELAWQQQEAADEEKRVRESAEGSNRTASHSSLSYNPCIAVYNSDLTPGIEFSEIMLVTGC